MAMIRLAVRVLLIDPIGRTLLLFHGHPHDDEHWAPPGGGVEVGESLEQAARREVREEIGVSHLELTTPGWEWQHIFSFNGKPVDQHETYFVARVGLLQAEASAAEWQRDGIRSVRWWTAAELAATTEEVWPTGLAGRLVQRVADRTGRKASSRVSPAGGRSAGRCRRPSSPER
jgi:ADP-ribose pyrophosphatase YjhB (NUDIX family)